MQLTTRLVAKRWVQCEPIKSETTTRIVQEASPLVGIRGEIDFTMLLGEGVTTVLTYTAHGLSIRSEFPIPEFSTSIDPRSGPDIIIRRSELPGGNEQDPTGAGRAYHLSSREFLYVNGQCGRFLVRNGDEIIVDPDPEVEDRVWRLSLFGAALGLLLIQRGYLMLHGGAVAFPAGTALLLGPSLMGKSTLTSELCLQGGRLLTDDVVSIETSASPPMVMPGIPFIKLWPDTISHAPDGAWTRALHPDFSKLGHRVEDGTLADPTPVGRIYVLAVGEKLESEPISGVEAFKALMASLYATRYGESFVSGLAGHETLVKMTRLLDHATVTVLRRPRDLGLLPETAAMIAGELTPEACDPPGLARR